MEVFGMNGQINKHGCSRRKKGSKGFRSLLAPAVAALTIGVPVALGVGLSPASASLYPPPSRASSGAAALTVPAAADAQLPSASTPAPFRPGVVLVGFREGVSLGERYALERAAGGQGARHLGPTIRPAGRGNVAGQEFLSPLELQVPATQTQSVIDRLRRDPAVAYAEPDYLMLASATPDDPSFPLQWADSNTGQSIPYQESEEILGSPAPGTSGDDDGALAAWQVSTGSRSIVIGETDTGVDYEHPDLAANIWSNPGGIGSCPAGTHGYNVLSKNCNPMDEDTAYGGHGTHVAGIMGAVGNNGAGVAGVNWQTTILPVKWLNTASYGETGALIEALQWLVAAKQAGVNLRVVNDSATFVGTASSQALSNEIDVLGANNILFVTAAGNTGENNDEPADRRYPCGYDRPTEICVTASNDRNELPSWANYGPHTVNLAAPGVSIYSTLRENKYGYLSGGSMASAQVAAAAALILSVKPSLSATELKADILDNVAPEPALSDKVITGGILDICKALPGCEEPPPPPPNPQPPPSPPSNPTTPPSSTPASSSAAAVTTASSATAVVTTGSASTAITLTARLPVHHGSVVAKLRCIGPRACAGKLELTVKTRIKVKGQASTRKQTIGIATFSITSGKTVTVTIALNVTGRALWRAAQGHLIASLTLFQSSPPPTRSHTQSVVLGGGRPW
jgi:thermitase